MPRLDDLKNFPIPEIAKGTVLPNSVYQKIQEEENQQQQLDELKKISDSTQRQLKIMEEQLSKYKNELESAKKDLLFSRITTVIAIIISIVAIVIPLL